MGLTLQRKADQYRLVKIGKLGKLAKTAKLELVGRPRAGRRAGRLLRYPYERR